MITPRAKPPGKLKVPVLPIKWETHETFWIDYKLGTCGTLFLKVKTNANGGQIAFLKIIKPSLESIDQKVSENKWYQYYLMVIKGEKVKKLKWTFSP